MSKTLKKRIQEQVSSVPGSDNGSWMVWCDPQGHWTPVLEKVVSNGHIGPFTLVKVTERTAGEVGGPKVRAAIQKCVEAGEAFLLLVNAPSDDLGWVWAHALMAERIYDRPLRDQLLEWGWHPQSLTVSDKEVLALALANLNQDPAEWGGGGLQPSPDLLLRLLAGVMAPDSDQRILIDITTEHAGIPSVPADADGTTMQRWRNNALAQLLVTDAHEHAAKLVPDNHELLIPREKRRSASELLDRWTDSVTLSKALTDAIPRADSIAGLDSLVGKATLKDGPFLSYAAERVLFVGACSQLAQKSDKELLVASAGLREDIAKHKVGFWGEREPSPPHKALLWGELLRLSQAANTLLEASPSKQWSSPDEAVEWYINGGWRVEQAGEEFLKNLSSTTPELLNLITPLRSAYRARWEEYMRRWSDVWVGAACAVPSVETAGEWLAGNLQNGVPAAILVIDALRYDLGATLVERINEQEGTERAVVSPGRAPLPSITALGMGTNMPIAESELRAEILEGKWQIHQLGRPENFSNAQQRRQWWQQHGNVPDNGFVSIAQILAGDMPEPSTKCIRLVAYDDTIDKLGHDDELEALGGGVAVGRYVQAIERLRDKGWRRVLMVTDHGYIHWDGREEKDVPLPADNPSYTNRRAAAYDLGVKFDGPQGLAPGGTFRVAVPRGTSTFRAYGGLGYFHGGASLQEWIIPCIRVEWPGEAKPVGIKLEVLYQVLGQRPHVTLLVVKESLFVDEALPRQVDVVIRNASTKSILFRSDPVKVTPAQEQVDVALKDVEGVEAERGTKLRIEVRDLSTDEILDSCDSTLMIELTGW